MPIQTESPALPSSAGADELALNQDPELVADFLMESREHLCAVEAQLLALENDPRNLDSINAIFRGFHTIKGLAGFLEFAEIQTFAHEVETLLDNVRTARVGVDAVLVDLILASADHLNESLLAVETGSEAGSSAPLVARIQSMAGDVHSPKAEPVRAAVPAAAGMRFAKVDLSKFDRLMATENEPRMVPIGQLFARFSRLVRDLARKTGKQAKLEISGGEIELDRNMVGELGSSLMHMIRNAVDHGVEPPEARIAQGKNPMARIDLKAYCKGGFTNIEIADDGRGLVRERILAEAQQRGLLSGGEHLSDQEIFRFIFEPGFSTAEQVTEVSGRGVGMDVVRTQVTKLSGRIEILSRPGCGTTFTIKLPLTLR